MAEVDGDILTLDEVAAYLKSSWLRTIYRPAARRHFLTHVKGKLPVRAITRLNDVRLAGFLNADVAHASASSVCSTGSGRSSSLRDSQVRGRLER
jgi:hypothetical protein